MLPLKLLNVIIFKVDKISFFLLLFLLTGVNELSGQQIPAWQQLMPKPSSIKVEKGIFIVHKSIKVAVSDTASKRVRIAAVKFIRRLTGRTGLFVTHGFPVSQKLFSKADIWVNYKRNGKLQLHEDESYQIQITPQQIKITAETDLGVVYAFETLLQLLDYNEQHYFFQNLTIKDYPAFTWRGLLIDVSRHFEPVDVIKRNLDAMVVAKMNVFHWHLSDDHGFRVEIKKYPQLTEKASDGQFYTQAQIKDIVQYAGDRGIKVLPEIDVPGHATALLTAFPEIGSKKMPYKLQRNAGIFDPTLDPSNPKTYEILENIFKEMASLFPFEYFHIGGDENRGKHWDENPDIQIFKKKHGLKNNHDLQTYFNIKLAAILIKYNKKVMGWDEIMTPGIPKSAVIHVWRGKQGKRLAETVQNGYHAVLSNGFYIDLMLPAATHYKNKMYPENVKLSTAEKKLILGGEATMWGELVTPLTIDSRIWPRTLAIGERLWRNPDKTTIKNMYDRLFKQSWLLEELGITHLRNRDVILRNITENQDISTLRILAQLYEPLKYYTRNKGGKKYQTYSPFTLFADACSADAYLAIQFNYNVSEYLKQPNLKNKQAVLNDLQQWASLEEGLLKLQFNPKLKKLLPMTSSLTHLSKELLNWQKQPHRSGMQLTKHLNELYSKAVKPYNDVTLATAKSLQQLIRFWMKAN